MKIATYNVNRINGRPPVLLRWLAESAPDRDGPASAHRPPWRATGGGDLIPRPSAQEDFADDIEETGRSAPERKGVADEWVYVIDAEAFVRRSDGKKWKKEQWKARYAGMMPQGDIINAIFRGIFPVRKFEALVYVPGGPEFPDGEKGGRYNIWKPSGVAARRGDVTPFLEYMTYLFPDETERGHALDYLAMLVQRPDQKVNYALLVKGGTLSPRSGSGWPGSAPNQ